MLRAGVVLAVCGAALASAPAAATGPSVSNAPAKCLGYVVLRFDDVTYVSRAIGRRLRLAALHGVGIAHECDDTSAPGEGAPPAYRSAVRRLDGIRPRIAVAARWEGHWRLFVATDRCALARPTPRLLRCLRDSG